MLIYTKGRELIEKDLIEQEKTKADENNQVEETHEIKTAEPKRQKKTFRRFFRKM
ncbi:hypothetical protein HUG20_00425 [Salicibibacter cibi]|uniref:Uncharacterized protein n=1 Tax=Salicibibacter cibi TaxID=2743001 RepID=A0A7T7CE03_9BACI|nr:hypothetical protein [Salicibibacter cibi]QQK78539.1 hypothetical protein HUG20_00425 [Salicibibacter cibi]